MAIGRSASDRLAGAWNFTAYNKIAGWALYPESPDRVVEVEITNGEGQSVRLMADEFREDLYSESSSGFCGFEVELPDEFWRTVGSTRYLWVRDANSMVNFGSSPQALPAPYVRRHTPRVVHGTVFGWAVNLTHPEEAVELHLMDGDNLIATAVAEDQVDYLGGEEFREGRCGFRFDLPDRLLEGALHHLVIKVAATGELLPSLPMCIRTPFSSEARDFMATYRQKMQAAVAGFWAGNQESGQRVLLEIAAATGLSESDPRKPIYRANVELPKYEEVDVSLVVSVLGEEWTALQTALSFIASSEGLRCEVIFVVEENSPCIQNLTRRINGARIEVLSSMADTSVAWNAGADKAEGRVIVFAAPGLLFEPSSAAELISVIDHESCFQAFPNVSTLSGEPISVRDLVSGLGLPAMPINRSVSSITYHGPEQILSVSASAFSEVGRFREGMETPWTVADLSLRLDEGGFGKAHLATVATCRYAIPDDQVKHPSVEQVAEQRSRLAFAKNWSNCLVSASHVKPVALYVDFQVPRWDCSAGGKCAINEIAFLIELGFRVILVAPPVPGDKPYQNALARLGVECVILEPDGELGAEIPRPSFIVYVRYQSVLRFQDLFVKFWGKVPSALNLADLHSLREFRGRIHGGADDAEARRSIARLEADEFRAMDLVDFVWTYSQEEQEIISHRKPLVQVELLPWLIPFACTPSNLERRSGIAFIGGYDHAPNADAVTYFYNEILPIVRSKGCDEVFHIYGSNMPRGLYALSGDGVLAHGYVDSLADVYSSTRVFVSPLRYGAGVKGKVLESLAYGCPLVATSLSLEGMPDPQASGCISSDDPEEFASSVIKLLTDDELWTQRVNMGHEYCKEYFGFERCITNFEITVQGLGVITHRTGTGNRFLTSLLGTRLR